MPITAHVALDKGAPLDGHRGAPRAAHRRLRRRRGCDGRPHRRPDRSRWSARPGDYPHGLIDPIEELGALAQERGIGLHVDGCLGGFLLPWIEALGYDVPPWDFRVPGVTSISADTHKYGYALKGTSTLLYRNKELRKHQYFTYPGLAGRPVPVPRAGRLAAPAG